MSPVMDPGHSCGWWLDPDPEPDVLAEVEDALRELLGNHGVDIQSSPDPDTWGPPNSSVRRAAMALDALTKGH